MWQLCWGPKVGRRQEAAGGWRPMPTPRATSTPASESTPSAAIGTCTGPRGLWGPQVLTATAHVSRATQAALRSLPSGPLRRGLRWGLGRSRGQARRRALSHEAQGTRLPQTKASRDPPVRAGPGGHCVWARQTADGASVQVAHAAATGCPQASVTTDNLGNTPGVYLGVWVPPGSRKAGMAVVVTGDDPGASPGARGPPGI